MTKLKSKKMTKSTFAVIIMAVLLVAMLAFGGTYAYFTATTTDLTASGSTGKILLANNTGATATFSIANMVDDEESSFTATYADASNRASYVFFKVGEIDWGTDLVGNPTVDFDVTSVVVKDTKGTTETSDDTEISTSTIKDTDGVTVLAYYFANGSETNSVATGIVAEFTVTVTVQLNADVQSSQGVDESNVMGNTFTVSLEAESIQQSGLSAAEAYEHVFTA